ncbi:MAG: protein TolR [Limimaricola sp.]|uniref:ExbD/TolR family protein n=1 Tax=Limimaricola sp. TaxID=2211665 RepID=UPI001D69799B|nr:ExbD/TolR family protein [Limimaricola sp.]MBI1416061.1 protein TolR [Limimaricola sp.]
MAAGVMKQASGGGSGHRRRRRRAQPMSEINVTPLVDVMLVLLIVFMVAAPLMTVGVPVKLPKTEASALPTDQEEPLTVTLTASGEITLQKTVVPRDQLVDKLRAVLAERKSDRIYLRADAASSWDAVAQVMGILNAAGFSNIGLVTDTATHSAGSTTGSGG